MAPRNDRLLPLALRRLLFAACWLTVASAQATPPSARIIGPATALPGDLVVLDASSSDAMGFAWVLADSNKTFLPVDDGQRLVFATGSTGRYTFVLVAANADESGKPAVALAKHVVTIGADPGPGPNPDPNPPGPEPPDPPLPPGRFDLARQARDWTASVTLAASERRHTAALVADGFEAIAAAIAAGTVRTAEDALAQLRAAHQAALSAPQYEAWRAGWNPSFRAAMTRLDDLNQLPALADVADAFREISQGLRGVR